MDICQAINAIKNGTATDEEVLVVIDLEAKSVQIGKHHFKLGEIAWIIVGATLSARHRWGDSWRGALAQRTQTNLDALEDEWR